MRFTDAGAISQRAAVERNPFLNESAVFFISSVVKRNQKSSQFQRLKTFERQQTIMMHFPHQASAVIFSFIAYDCVLSTTYQFIDMTVE